MQEVYINRLAKYLPNDPIPNEAIEDVLGYINGKPSRAKAIVLRNNGIKSRYYALKDGKSTHSNAELTALAIKGLFPEGKVDTDLLTCGTSFPDQILPSHAAMTLGLLKTHPTEIYSPSGACCSSIQGLKHAYLSIKSGDAQNAVATGSEKLSNMMDATKFDGEIENLEALNQNGFIAFEKDFLRYMLSDGAAAAYLSNQPNKEDISLRIDWIDMTSFSNELDTCMYAGAVKDESGAVVSWKDMDVKEWRNQSVFAVKQDTRLLGQYVVSKGVDFLVDIIAKRGLDLFTYNHFLPHLSSNFFREEIKKGLALRGLEIPADVWFTNLDRVGNVGAASPFLMLEELFHSGRLNKGEKILMMIPESARFIYAYIQITVV
ncbi:hypothetical protein DBR32_06900 [Taibaiella sp. KBW10]|uniref:beta-ketoacyl-ACP synthase III n=1 Tax=Taibaiella sp. KBW10 TaxID=2153357 RepID=UPI000F591BF2|nr:beta-ketoacyl-ACP synthase III [Taibaiella sp. KBW10]RQO31852.1 hypothetical protein DBR32_06900 [Taibaiella sp. KBW10]